jgi:hypothetical protein
MHYDAYMMGVPMFLRDNKPIMTFRVYDGWGNCINEFTGTLDEWQTEVAIKLHPSPDRQKPGTHLRLVK